MIEWAWTRGRLSFVKGQLRLIFCPVDHVEKHPAFEHFLFEIGGVCFFHSGVSRTRNWVAIPCRFNASSAARAPRTASYIMVRLSFVNAL
jgi:hypothetical protein